MSRLTERIENFNKAFETFEETVNAYNSNKEYKVFHMAAIQAFEVCFELGVKILKDYLTVKKIFVQFPKDAVKEAFAHEVIPDGQIWMDMQRDRNTSSHEYNAEKVLDIIQKICSVYYEELKRFKISLEEING